MKEYVEILAEIRRLKHERKNLYLELVNIHKVAPRIAVIGVSKYTTQILALRWVLS